MQVNKLDSNLAILYLNFLPQPRCSPRRIPMTLKKVQAMQIALMLSCIGLMVQAAENPPAQRPPKPGAKTPGVQVPIADLKPEAVFEVPGSPDWQVVGEGVVYISTKPKNSVTRLDAKTNKVAAVIPIGAKPCSGLAIGFGSLWVPNCGDQTVSRVDLKTDKVTATFSIGVGDTEGGLAVGAGSVWMLTDKKGTLARTHPAVIKLTPQVVVPAGS